MSAVQYPRRELIAMQFEVSSGVAHITLNRPEIRNAISRDLCYDFLEVALRCKESRGVRAVLITGNGPTFTVGGDIAMFSEMEPHDLRALLLELGGPFHEAMAQMAELDAPVVCACHGAVAGGGLGFIYCADIVLAATSTKFATGFSRIGISGDGGNSWYLPRLVGMRRAAEMYLQNRVLNADEALAYGLINRVVEPDRLHAEALQIASHIANGPTLAYGEIRRLLHRSWSSTLREQMAAEVAGIGRTAITRDSTNGLRSFINGTTPAYEGD